MADQVKYILTKEDENLYIKELLQRRLLFSSRLRRKLKAEGGVTLNGEPVRLRAKGREGDVLCVSWPEENSYFEPEDIPLGVPYEDGDLLVVDKPAGIVVHPTKNFQNGTLANALAYRMKEQGVNYKIRFVNRLDMNTSGLVIVAKNAHAQDFLSHEMAHDRVFTQYLALVYGEIAKDGTIDAPIDKDPCHVARRMVRADGYPSVTHYHVLRSFAAGELPGAPCEAPCTLLAIKLDTGRTHQIRVHLTHIGHPIVGDDLYAPVCGYDPPYPVPRQLLHAARLCFIHPQSGEPVDVFASLPEDMRNLIGEVAAIASESYLKVDIFRRIK